VKHVLQASVVCRAANEHGILLSNRHPVGMRKRESKIVERSCFASDGLILIFCTLYFLGTFRQKFDNF
jgi:hypothetical protein